MKKIYSLFLFMLAISGLIVSQYFFDTQKKKEKFQEPFVLKPEIIKAADLGLHNAAADLSWLYAIQYLGSNKSETNEKLSDYLFLTSDLDPKFTYPYAFGALLLPNLGYPDQGIELAKKGLGKSKPDWRIPYYLATAYHIDKTDSKNAAKYLDVAANTPGAPDGIKKVAANYGSRNDKRGQTKQIWVGIYETTNDQIVKERAKNYIIHFEILDLLEQASKQYYQINKKYPSGLNDLISSRILKTIPADPFGFQFEINQKDGSAITK